MTNPASAQPTAIGTMLLILLSASQGASARDNQITMAIIVALNIICLNYKYTKFISMIFKGEIHPEIKMEFVFLNPGKKR